MFENLKFSVLTVNVRGLREYRKRRKIYNWLVKHGGQNSICFIQKAHCTPDVSRMWEQQWRGNSYFAYCTSQSAGVIILIGNRVEYVEDFVKVDVEGRFILLYCKIQGSPILLVNTYAPKA